jgi:hypothetical protein
MKMNLYNFEITHVCERFPRILIERRNGRARNGDFISLDGWDTRPDRIFFFFFLHHGRAEAAIVGHEILPPTHRLNMQTSEDMQKCIRFKSPKQVAAAVACSVTAPASEYHWLARNGDESLFALIGCILPEVVPDLQARKLHLRQKYLTVYGIKSKYIFDLFGTDHPAQTSQESVEWKDFGSCFEQEAADQLCFCLCKNQTKESRQVIPFS